MLRHNGFMNEGEMEKICKDCGVKLNAEDKVCATCGYSIGRQKDKNF